MRGSTRDRSFARSTSNSGTFTPFPALYIAEDYETAFSERFGLADKRKIQTLSADELALRGG
jgi:hypothetical protein